MQEMQIGASPFNFTTATRDTFESFVFLDGWQIYNL